MLVRYWALRGRVCKTAPVWKMRKFSQQMSKTLSVRSEWITKAYMFFYHLYGCISFFSLFTELPDSSLIFWPCCSSYAQSFLEFTGLFSGAFTFSFTVKWSGFQILDKVSFPKTFPIIIMTASLTSLKRWHHAPRFQLFLWIQCYYNW